nr:hypothetical protein [Candidatus Kapabacteria bacterium]
SIFEVTRDTVSAWIDPWEEEAFDGLEDTPLPGRPRKTTAEEDAMLCKIVELHLLMLRASVCRVLQRGLGSTAIGSTWI